MNNHWTAPDANVQFREEQLLPIWFWVLVGISIIGCVSFILLFFDFSHVY